MTPYPAKYEALYDEANKAVTKTVRSVLSTSSSIVNLGVEVEDVTQEVWLQCWLALEQGKDITVNWMTRVAKRAASNYRRGSQFEQGLFSSLDEPVMDSAGEESSFLDTYIPPGALDKADERPARLMEALRQLPPAHSELLFAFYLEKESIQDIATGLGISLNAATLRLSRARHAVVSVVGKDGFKEILVA